MKRETEFKLMEQELKLRIEKEEQEKNFI